MLLKFLYKLIDFLENDYPIYKLKIKEHINKIWSFILDEIKLFISICKVCIICCLAYTGILIVEFKKLYKFLKNYIDKLRSKLSDETWALIFFAILSCIALTMIVRAGNQNQNAWLQEIASSDDHYYSAEFIDDETYAQTLVAYACDKYNVSQVSILKNESSIYYYLKIDNLYSNRQEKINNCLMLWNEITECWNNEYEIKLFISDSRNTEVVKVVIEKTGITYI